MEKKIKTIEDFSKTMKDFNAAVGHIIIQSINLIEEIKELKNHPNITPSILRKLKKIENELT